MNIVVRFLIFFLSGLITISLINYPLTNLAQMTNNKFNTTAVEVNGIRFEIRLNNPVIPLPPREEEEEVPGEEKDIFALEEDLE